MLPGSNAVGAAPGTLSALIDILFPPVCPLCEKALREGGLCRPCALAFDSLRIGGPCCTVCGEPFPSAASGGHACGECLKEPPPFKRALSLFAYSKEVADAIHLFKYGLRTSLAPALSDLMLEGAAAFPAPDVVMPVPLHPARLKSRKFNQAWLLASCVARALSADSDPLSLKRTRETGSQVGLSAEERTINVKGAFSVSGKERLKDRLVLLVDDVYTTGATIRECSKALTKAGAEVYALTLARTIRPA